MSIVRARETTRSDRPVGVDGNFRDLPQQQTSSAPRRLGEKSEQASSLMGRLTLESTFEIDRLIDALKKLSRGLEFDGNRVQRDIAAYSSLSQSVIQLTKIVSESMVHVKKVSDSPNTDTETHIPAFLTTIEQQ